MRQFFLLAVLLLPLPAYPVDFDWVTVGDPRNAADWTGYGSVADTFLISEYEVTNAQYAEFLNAVDPTGADGMDPWGAANTLGLYDWSMTWGDFGGIDFVEYNPDGSKYVAKSGMSSKPVNYVSFFDSLRFANWLNNGQGAASTEAGAYTLLGGTSLPTNWATVTRNAGARIFLTSEDEWYKAAYYDAISTGYFGYPVGTDAVTTCATPAATPNTANCGNAVGDLTDVGSYTGSASPYGTFDQGGNVYEWNEAIIVSNSNTYRGLRGGSFSVLDDAFSLESSSRGFTDPTLDRERFGFRVAMIPEPSNAQQSCINAMNRNGASVNKAQLKEIEGCLKDYQKGTLSTTFEVCTAADRKGEVQKACESTVKREAKKCDPLDPPLFGYAEAATVNQAAVAGASALADEIFGDPAQDADLFRQADDKSAAACQSEMLKQASKLEQRIVKEILKAKKSALRDGRVDRASALEATLIIALTREPITKVQERLEKAEEKLKRGVDKKCGGLGPPNAIFRGDCGDGDPSLADVEDCVIAAARCQACSKIEAFDGLDLPCSRLSGGDPFSSCP